MYEHLSRRVQATIERLGREAVILDRSTGSVNRWNNPSESYTDNGTTVTCVRTYPNRNTEVTSSEGDLHRDRPLFVFPDGEVPDEEARLRYPEDAESVENATTTTLYEMKAATKYDTHVEMFGEVVVNP